MTEDIEKIIAMALYAPSAHNSQPWKFKVDGKKIFVYLEPSRMLSESDKEHRQAFESIGCVVKAVEIVASHYNYSTATSYIGRTTDDFLAVEIIFDKKITNEERDSLALLLPKRITNRYPYEKTPLPPSFVERLKLFNTEEIHVDLIAEKSLRDRIADITLKAMIETLDNKGFRKELSQYVKSNVSSSKIGIPAYGMGIPTPVSFFVPTLIRFLNISRLNKRKDEKLLKEGTPAFIVISSVDNPVSWMKVGMTYLHIALLAEQNGLKTAPWTAPIETSSYHKELRQLLDLKMRPQLLTRIGYTKKVTRPAPRLPLHVILES